MANKYNRNDMAMASNRCQHRGLSSKHVNNRAGPSANGTATSSYKKCVPDLFSAEASSYDDSDVDGDSVNQPTLSDRYSCKREGLKAPRKVKSAKAVLMHPELDELVAQSNAMSKSFFSDYNSDALRSISSCWERADLCVNQFLRCQDEALSQRNSKHQKEASQSNYSHDEKEKKKSKRSFSRNDSKNNVSSSSPKSKRSKSKISPKMPTYDESTSKKLPLDKKPITHSKAHAYKELYPSKQTLSDKKSRMHQTSIYEDSYSSNQTSLNSKSNKHSKNYTESESAKQTSLGRYRPSQKNKCKEDERCTNQTIANKYKKNSLSQKSETSNESGANSLKARIRKKLLKKLEQFAKQYNLSNETKVSPQDEISKGKTRQGYGNKTTIDSESKSQWYSNEYKQTYKTSCTGDSSHNPNPSTGYEAYDEASISCGSKLLLKKYRKHARTQPYENSTKTNENCTKTSSSNNLIYVPKKLTQSSKQNIKRQESSYKGYEAGADYSESNLNIPQIRHIYERNNNDGIVRSDKKVRKSKRKILKACVPNKNSGSTQVSNFIEKTQKPQKEIVNSKGQGEKIQITDSERRNKLRPTGYNHATAKRTEHWVKNYGNLESDVIELDEQENDKNGNCLRQQNRSKKSGISSVQTLNETSYKKSKTCGRRSTEKSSTKTSQQFRKSSKRIQESYSKTFKETTYDNMSELNININSEGNCENDENPCITDEGFENYQAYKTETESCEYYYIDSAKSTAIQSSSDINSSYLEHQSLSAAIKVPKSNRSDVSQNITNSSVNIRLIHRKSKLQLTESSVKEQKQYSVMEIKPKSIKDSTSENGSTNQMELKVYTRESGIQTKEEELQPLAALSTETVGVQYPTDDELSVVNTDVNLEQDYLGEQVEQNAASQYANSIIEDESKMSDYIREMIEDQKLEDQCNNFYSSDDMNMSPISTCTDRLDIRKILLHDDLKNLDEYEASTSGNSTLLDLGTSETEESLMDFYKRGTYAYVPSARFERRMPVDKSELLIWDDNDDAELFMKTPTNYAEYVEVLAECTLRACCKHHNNVDCKLHLPAEGDTQAAETDIEEEFQNYAKKLPKLPRSWKQRVICWSNYLKKNGRNN